MGEIIIDPTVVALQTLQEPQKDLFDKIDGLRSLGVGRIVDLPQIIVVGDESSGKSSVLEAISRVRFPVDREVCTRFATELVLRHYEETNISVSIDWEDEAADDVKKEAEKKLGSFSKKEDLDQIVRTAAQLMGIRKGSRNFCKDVLRIKILAPDVPDLTLVDLPGFWYTDTPSQTEEDQELVNELVRKYMMQKNSIILAVVSAATRLKLQRVLSEPGKPGIDPNRERTIGVLTHPDKVELESKDGKEVMRLAKNQHEAYKLSHGWHVLRNRGEKEKGWSDERRDHEESEFLSRGVWASLHPEDKGVVSLRKKLSGLLYKHIVDNLPSVTESMQKSLSERQKKMRKLGRSRATPEDMRVYLTGIAQAFETLAREAVRGSYGDHDFFGDLSGFLRGSDIGQRHIRNLRAVVRDMNRAFVATMYSKGAKHSIVWEDGADDSDERRTEIPDFLKPLVDKHYNFSEPEKMDEKVLKEMIEVFAAKNQGLEFPGRANPRVAIDVFRLQAEPWHRIATCHIELVISTTKQFVQDLLEHVVASDTDTLQKIMKDCVEPFFRRKEDVLTDKLHELLPQPDETGFSLPLEWEFEVLSKQRTDTRLNTQVHKLGEERLRSLNDAQRVAILGSRDYTRAWADEQRAQFSTPSKFGIENVIDDTIVYYELSLRTFIENVITLAVENKLMRDVPKIFESIQVAAMDEAKLRSLAAETPSILKERERLAKEIASLKDGLELCNTYRYRRP
ncbi:p-loop containing nucleoside triphosphate hydrolase protein [Pleurostoma richardsiae]|uniref:P-loop containing nucleoside triphosphate hydrolase protein n=1 Tax=Pleurostoma richardsiae TaxID=41990 RepID=A0AA38RXL8_9PEZI|nr:p-loop containing nucleoside triphosphate hydrolase protein [Pleurostoma richardsiae]